MIDFHGQVDVIFTDFSQAFDHDHRIILNNLCDFGISEVLKVVLFV